jgi:hypothetical protein
MAASAAVVLIPSNGLATRVVDEELVRAMTKMWVGDEAKDAKGEGSLGPLNRFGEKTGVGRGMFWTTR